MDVLYNNFIKYFDNPCLTKIKQAQNGLSIYCVRISSMLALEKKYLVVMAYDNDTSLIGSFKFLNSIHWEVIQTKILKQDFNVMTHDYTPPKNLFFFKERMTRANSEIFRMENYNLTITINRIIPNDNITLGTAIELYNTTIFRGRNS